jgi:hypothetical protein
MALHTGGETTLPIHLPKLFFYVVLPLVVGSVLTGMYFSGNIMLQRLVSPALPPLSPDAWREFGLLENLQNAILLAVVGVALWALVRKRNLFERLGFAIILLGAGFVFLEEVDYGTHWYAYATSDHDFQWFQPKSEWTEETVSKIDFSTDPFNLHNRGSINTIMKSGANLGIALIFVVLPFTAHRVNNKWLRYFAPDRAIVLTVLVMVILRFAVHALGDWEKDLIAQAVEAGLPAPREQGTISLNLSEFRELNTYYLGLLYVWTLAFQRIWPATPQE